MFFQKSGSAWHPKDDILNLCTTGQFAGELRYPDRRAHMRAQYLKAQDSTRRAIADSVALIASRRVHGTVTNKQGRSPQFRRRRFSFVALPHIRIPGHAWLRIHLVVMRYTICHSAVRCSKSSAWEPGPRLGATPDAPGLWRSRGRRYDDQHGCAGHSPVLGSAAVSSARVRLARVE